MADKGGKAEVSSFYETIDVVADKEGEAETSSSCEKTIHEVDVPVVDLEVAKG